MHELMCTIISEKIIHSKGNPLSGYKLELSIFDGFLSKDLTRTSDDINSSMADKLRRESFLSPTSISDALNAIGIKDVFSTIAQRWSTKKSDIKTTLTLAYTRRNSIVHQNDYDGFTVPLQKVQITRGDVSSTAVFINKLVETINTIVKQEYPNL